MTIVYQPLAPKSEDLEHIHASLKGVYLDGQCYAFALMLNRGLGWPIVGLMHKDDIRHAAVRSPDGKLFDVRGTFDEEEFGLPFSIAPPYVMERVDAVELYARRFGDQVPEIVDQQLRVIQDQAELVWPELPWLAPRSARFIAFADALEQLSRSHGIWLFGQTPGQLPTMTVGEGDEEGYVLAPTMNNRIWTLDRRLA